MKTKTISIQRLIRFTSVIVLLLLQSSCIKDEAFISGEISEFTLQSAANGATYDIKVGLPVNYNPSEKYATLYVLDGKEIFGFVANRCREISDQYAKKNVLVVSIGYGKDRSIDYTPTKVSSVTGGAPQFLNFIESQLIPKMEQDYQADSTRDSRILLGHSYGGLFGGYTFSVNNAVIGNYIMLSPSFWFDNRVALQMEQDNLVKNKNKKQLVYLGIGENEERDRMLAPFELFYQTLRNNYNYIKLEKNIEKNTGHMDSRNPNIIKGLTYYFLNR